MVSEVSGIASFFGGNSKYKIWIGGRNQSHFWHVLQLRGPPQGRLQW